MIRALLAGLARLRRDVRGSSLILVSVAMPAILGISALAVDMGYAYYVKNRIQTAADLGALAGGSLLYTGDKAAVEAKALEYVNLNLPENWDGKALTSINITSTASTKCLNAVSSMGLTCDSSSKANAVMVTVNAATPMFFASALGYKRASFTASAMVSGAGATPPPLNIAIVIDTTASMNTPYTGSCGTLSNPTKLECAVAAARGMLGTLWPSVDQVALFTFPGVTSASIPFEYCTIDPSTKKVGTVKVVGYTTAAAPSYKIIDFSSDYRGSGTPPPAGLDSDSLLVKTLGGKSGCNGIQAIGGVKTFFADSITAAQQALEDANAALAKDNKPQRQNVLMLLSDGDANATSVNNPVNQCKQAIDAAAAAKDKKTWVYSVAYQADNSVGNSCKTDTSTTTSTTTTITTTIKVETTTTTKTCTRSNKTSCSSSTGSTKTTFPTPPAPYIVQGSVAAPATTVDNTTTQPTNPSCSPGTNCSSSTNAVKTTTSYSARVNTNTTTSYDRTACATMQNIASDTGKFYSVAGDSGCISEANPNVTDLVSIFKNVAVSLMKKRRIPVNVL